jgi:hypothetical protein
MSATWVMPPKGDVSTFLDAHPDTSYDDLARIEREALFWSPANEALGPAPDPVFVIPPFPDRIFPDDIEKWLDACAKSVGVPKEMVAFPFMALVGSMVGNRASIELKRGFQQYGSLWIAILADPGRGKSPALAQAYRPFNRMQENALEDYRFALIGWEEATQRWQVSDPEERGRQPIRPRLRHYLSTNATLEAVIGALESSPGVTLVFDELKKFMGGMNQYRGGKGADKEEFLSAWSGASIKLDRQTSEPKIISNPCIGVVGGITSDRVADLHSNDGSRDGTLERFLILRPQFDPPMWTEDDIDPLLIGPVMEVLQELDRLSPSDSEDENETIRLSKEAKAAFIAWFNENAELQRECSGVTAGFFSKLSMQVARIALILSLLRSPKNPGALITAQVMANAIDLGEFCRAHFLSTLPLLKESSAPRIGGLQSRIMRILRDPELQEFEGYVSRRTLLQKLGNVKAEDLSRTLEQLKVDGRIEKMIEQTATKPRECWRIVRAIVHDFPETPTDQIAGPDIVGCLDAT